MTAPAQGFLPGCEPQRGDVSSDACFTPLDIVTGAIVCLGGRIGTDPCWHPDSNVPDDGTRFDGRERGDGLAGEWHGSLWMNPPYSKPLPWAKRFSEHALTGARCLALVKLDPTTQAWRTLTENAACVGLLAKRVAFEGDFAKGQTPNMVVALVPRNISLSALVTHLPMASWWERPTGHFDRM